MQAVSFARGKWSPKTRTLYEQGWRDWCDWCRTLASGTGHEVSPLPAHPEAGIDMKSGMELSRHRTPTIYLGYVQKKSASENPAVKRLAQLL